ncbi:hypothetical protein ATSB10_20310 [Dyella thiooxydans]|uniref:Uncharacterized protein n=1 Tax=Dyella thiooxydans TaxID=445710 RepID=A0A161J9H9_9GAMM|nr:hypothetical protein ATSB10_20310 [Dyella thiooxydans]
MHNAPPQPPPAPRSQRKAGRWIRDMGGNAAPRTARFPLPFRAV